MSEVTDACQILMLSGRVLMATAGLSLKAAMLMMKVMNTVYLSKWKGSTSLHRFRAIKGDDYEFVNVCSEDQAILAKVEKEMEAHNLLFSRLPDLCGGDGNTQYVIARSDMNVFAAFLMDHLHSELRHVKVGPITESDYAKTAVRPESGEYTEEYRKLNESAKTEYRQQKAERVRETGQEYAKSDRSRQEHQTEQIHQIRRARRSRRSEGADATGEDEPMQEKTGRETSDREKPERKEIGRKDTSRENAGREETAREDTNREGTSRVTEPDAIYVTQRGRRRAVEPDELLEQEEIRIQDEKAKHGNNVMVVNTAPVREEEKWAMFPIMDGDSVVIIPREDILRGSSSREQHVRVESVDKKPLALLFAGVNYVVVSLKSGEQSIMSGRELMEEMKKPIIAEQQERLDNISRNISKNIGRDAVIPQTMQTKKRSGR